jgi:hypothetical protein
VEAATAGLEFLEKNGSLRQPSEISSAELKNTGVRGSVSTYRCVTSDQGRILQCTEERLSKIMNVEDTVTLLCPVGIIAKRMNPNMSEIGIPGEPFFWPEV